MLNLSLLEDISGTEILKYILVHEGISFPTSGLIIQMANPYFTSNINEVVNIIIIYQYNYIRNNSNNNALNAAIIITLSFTKSSLYRCLSVSFISLHMRPIVAPTSQTERLGLAALTCCHI